jgi:hypothetical protein
MIRRALTLDLPVRRRPWNKGETKKCSPSGSRNRPRHAAPIRMHRMGTEISTRIRGVKR